QYPPPWVRFVTRVPEITRSFGGPGPASRPSLEAGSTTGGGRAGAGARVLGSALAPVLGAAGQSPLTLTVGGPPLLSLAVGGDPRIDDLGPGGREVRHVAGHDRHPVDQTRRRDERVSDRAWVRNVQQCAASGDDGVDGKDPL